MTKLIAIEGPDRVGKKTQSTILANALKSKGKKVALVEVPYRSIFTYTLIYWMLKNGMAMRHPNLFQFTQFMNKFLFQLFVLPFMKMRNDYIIFDRWALSSIVYGTAGGANSKFCDFMYKLLMKPDVTLLLDGPSRIKLAEDVYEANNEMQQHVAQLYREYSNSNEFITIDTSRSIESTASEIAFMLGWLDLKGKT